MKKLMEVKYSLDLDKLPFGRLTKDSITKAFRVLAEI